MLSQNWFRARFCRLMVVAFTVTLLIASLAQSGFAQADPPLNFGQNFFVTGDYIVAGAQGMTLNLANGYATGIITIPDPNPGITGAKQVPQGAEVVAAELYWQTVENVGVMPGQPGSGQNGFFGPVFRNGPQLYPITGMNLGSNSTVTWSYGGCTSSQTGKVTRTYRANVLGALPRDPTGNIIVNGSANGNIYGTFAVQLPSAGPSTPLTLGATLVIIYRILSPSVPLNSIVIYDGSFGQSNTSLTMTQTVQGFYDAAQNAVSRLTHIVAHGEINKFQTVYLDGSPLPSLYGGFPAFPGFYGTWDNPTWTFNPNKTYVNVPNPIGQNAASATTEVIPSSSNQGCVSWGAVIFSTTVKNSDGDGLLDAWKQTPPGYSNPGYCDAAVNQGVCTPGSSSWVDLPGAVHGEKDVFVQLDYMCSQATGGDSCTTGDGINYSFDPRPSGAIAMVTGAFSAKGVHLHINPPGTNQPDVHAIQEPTCADNPNRSPALCAFPDQPGVVAWKGGFNFIKNQLVDPTGNVEVCTSSPPPADCMPRFQPGARYSKHYVLAAHAVGQPKWKVQDGTLTSVKQSGKTVTFTTSTPVGTLDSIVDPTLGSPVSDPSCPNGRVTIIGVATNTNLDGTFCITNPVNPLGTSFTISIGNSTNASYTFNTDPNLAVAPGFTSSASGVSDVGGADSLITLGLWGSPASPTSDGQKETVIAGTFMHELGHANGLTHGGLYYNSLTQSNQNYTPTIQPNCKPNYQSVMSYSVQVDLLTPLLGGPNVPDYSGVALPNLNKSTGGGPNALPGAQYANTNWYIQWPGSPPVGSPAKSHCDGTPITNSASMTRVPGLASSFSWAVGQDINFDGNTRETLQGYNDWMNIAYQQIGATGSNSTALELQSGGGAQFGGGGVQFGGGGAQFGGGGAQFGGGGAQFGGGGAQFGGGGAQFGGGGEINVATANSVTRPPQNLTATEGASPRTITLNWMASTFGQIGTYNIYRSSNNGATFNLYASVSGNPPATTYTDTQAFCNPTGYAYVVTAVLSSTSANPGQESVPSNTTVPASGQPLLTGCYTNTPPTVALTSLSFPNMNFVQGNSVPITWSLQDDNTSTYVQRPAASTALYAIGPIPYDGECSQLAKPPAFLGFTGTYPYTLTTLSSSGSGITIASNQFSFSWNTTNSNAGCYFFELDLDSNQYEQSTALTLLIYVSDSSPHVTTTTLPPGVVGNAYSNTIFEAGGVSPFMWTVMSGSLPPSISLGVASGTVSGTTCTAGSYNFTVKVIDSKSNYGTQALTLQIQKADTTTSVTSSPYPSTYGQAVTFTATVAPQSPCTPTGTVTFYDGATPISGAIPLSSATASYTTTSLQLMAGSNTITAVYSGDSNFYATGTGGSTANTLTQTVQKADTTTSVTVSPTSTPTLGDVVTVTGTVVDATNSSMGNPTGLVTFFVNGMPIGTGTLAVVSGSDQATFTTSLLAAGSDSITAAYDGDANFNATGADAGSTLTAAATETVALRATTETVALNPSTVGVGQPSTTTVTVTDNGYTNPAGTADSWVATSGTPTVGTTGSTATLFADGMVLMAGGANSSGTVVANAYIYNATSNTFTATGSLNAARTGATATLLPNGQILIAGGSSDGTATNALNTAVLYNPVTGTFTVAGSNSTPLNVMTEARFGATATLLQNGQVLIAGGENSGGSLASAEFYNPATDTFTATGAMLQARYDAAATLLATGNVLIAGGHNSSVLNETELYNPTAGTFSATGSLGTVRMGATATLLLSGNVLMAGGSSDGSTPLNSAEIYNPTTAIFTASNSTLNTARFNGTATLLPNGMVLLVGGTTSQVTELYDPDNDRFDQTGSLANADQPSLTATLLNKDNVLVIGLTSSGSPDAELYTPSFDPLGTVALTSSDTSDVFSGPCVLMISGGGASTCASTVTVPPGEVGLHTITGTYPADSVHSGNTGSASLTATPDP